MRHPQLGIARGDLRSPPQLSDAAERIRRLDCARGMRFQDSVAVLVFLTPERERNDRAPGKLVSSFDQSRTYRGTDRMVFGCTKRQPSLPFQDRDDVAPAIRPTATRL